MIAIERAQKQGANWLLLPPEYDISSQSTIQHGCLRYSVMKRQWKHVIVSWGISPVWLISFLARPWKALNVAHEHVSSRSSFCSIAPEAFVSYRTIRLKSMDSYIDGWISPVASLKLFMIRTPPTWLYERSTRVPPTSYQQNRKFEVSLWTTVILSRDRRSPYNLFFQLANMGFNFISLYLRNPVSDQGPHINTVFMCRSCTGCEEK